jgi:tetratricopeptide (TPR) repeat protein
VLDRRLDAADNGNVNWCVTLAATVIAQAAYAAPAADVVVYWEDDGSSPLAVQLRNTAQKLNAAFVDQSPQAARDDGGFARKIAAGIAAYEALRFEESIAALSAAEPLLERVAASDADAHQISDLFLIRGLSYLQLGNKDRAWDDFVQAATVAPARVLDPTRFSPRAIEQFQRAKTAVARLEKARIEVRTDARCEAKIDGSLDLAAAVPRGVHWVHVTCPAAAPLSRRVLIADEQVTVELQPLPVAPPSDMDVVIAARTLNARAVLLVVVSGDAVVMRRLGMDGRELARRAVSATAAEEVRTAAVDLLAGTVGPRVAQPWYRSRWVWMAAGAVIASAALAPFVFDGGSDTPEVVLRPGGDLPW